MRTWLHRLRQALRPRRPASPRTRLALESLEDRCLLDAGGVMQTALTSSVPGLAAHLDTDLINPWGFSETPTGQFRISANGAGNAPLLNAYGAAVSLPPPLGSPPGTTTTPNGQVANTTADFVISDDGRSAPASVIFSTEDGTLIGFNPNIDTKQGILVADQSATGAVYKLLAADSVGSANFLYATDFHNNKIDVFDKNFHKVTLGTNGFGTFTDPNELAGFAPFGIKNIGGTRFVTYAKQLAPDNHDDQEGPGNGFIDEFDSSGHFIERFATGGTLNSPIGMAIAPDGFGRFGGDLLVGNFGDSRVSAFDPTTGVFLGQLTDAAGNPLVLNGGFQETNPKGLWGIAFGNGHNGAGTNTLFFAAGINAEKAGLFGKVDFTPAVTGETQIASGFAHRTDPNALVVGPTGLAYDPRTGTLYVASTADNAIYAIGDAADTRHDKGKGRLIFDDPTHLHGPLGLVLAPNGDLIVANGDAVNSDPLHSNQLVEITRTGRFVGTFQLDSGPGGAAFGLAVTTDNGVVRFAAVDDNTNTMHVWTLQQASPMHHGDDA